MNTKSRNSGNQGTGTDSSTPDSSSPESGNQGTESDGQGTNEDEINQNKHDEILNQNLDSLGDHLITYSITDSWGRPAEVKTRQLNLTSSINNNKIEVYYMYLKSGQPDRVPGFEITFNHDTKKLKTEVKANNNPTFSWHNYQLDMYHIKLVGADGKTKFQQVISSTNRVGDIANALNGKDFAYGDKLILETNQGKMLKIQGSVINGAEDYSDGVDFGYILSNTEFTLTENGFEAEIKDKYQDKDNENTITWLAGYNGVVGFRITTDRENMQLKVDKGINEHIDTENYNNTPMIVIELFGKNGNSKRKVSLKGRDKPENVVNALNNGEFEVGDYFEIRSTIQGSVINGAEDYSDGVDFGYILSNTEFTLTENGFEAEVKDKYQDEDKENTITWLAGYNGVVGFRITTDRQTMQLKVDKGINEHIDTENHNPNIMLSIKLVKQNGQDLLVSLKGRDKPENVVNALNNRPFEVGDYFEIRSTTKSKNLRISGDIVEYDRNRKQLESYADGIDDVDNIDNVRFYITENGLTAVYNEAPKIIGADDALLVKQLESYADGIDDVDNIDNVRFYITENGLTAVYNEAPKIIGADDALLVKRRNNGLGNVTVEDDFDSPDRITVEPVGNVDEAQIGAYMLSYRATDSWGRSSESDRFVVVQAPPVIEEHDDKKTVEMGSITTEQVENYLKKEVVTITDEEDDRDKKELDIDITGTFNPDEVGTNEISYTVTDSDGHKTTAQFNIEVVKTINVDVPIKMPFQVVTNLKDKKANPFISGVMKVNNNNIHSTVIVLLM